MSTTIPPDAAAVTWYHTLASVRGAPHRALSCASSASVVASLVSSVSLNGTDPTTVRPAYVSLPGGAANAGAAVVTTAPSASAAVAAHRTNLMKKPSLCAGAAEASAPGTTGLPRSGEAEPSLPPPRAGSRIVTR